jgi:hypothetical protein
VSGDILKFVDYFNSLSERQCPWYSQFKIQLYDINQRRFVVERADGKDIYIVHYNGFAFGTNLSKMIVIREREAPLQRDLEVVLGDSSDISDQSDIEI